MANQDIKDFTVEWVTFGVLFFALLSFALIFVYNNNPTALGDSKDIFEGYNNNLSSQLELLEQDTNSQINTSAVLTSSNTQIGAGAASSTSYSFFSTSKDTWKNSKGFISWILSGTAGKILISVIGGIIGIVALFYIIRLIRSIT